MKRFSSISLPFFVAAVLSAGAVDALAQVDKTPFTGARGRVGAYAGAQMNLIGAGTQNIGNTPVFNQPIDQTKYVDGVGFGPYAGVMFEYHNGGMLGFQARVGYDHRAGTSEDNTAPGGNFKMTTRLTYLNLEGGLRVNIASPNFFVIAGPSLAFLLTNEYETTSNNPALTVPNGVYSAANNVAVGLWGGFGYDLLINDPADHSRWYLTPFAEASWLFDQRKEYAPQKDNVDDAMSTVSLRAGVQLKWGEAPPAPGMRRD